MKKMHCTRTILLELKKKERLFYPIENSNFVIYFIVVLLQGELNDNFIRSWD